MIEPRPQDQLYIEHLQDLIQARDDRIYALEVAAEAVLNSSYMVQNMDRDPGEFDSYGIKAQKLWDLKIAVYGKQDD